VGSTLNLGSSFKTIPINSPDRFPFSLVSQISVSVLVRFARNLCALACRWVDRGSWLGCVLLLAELTACTTATTVRDVQAHPHRNWFTATVQLRGIVGDRAPLLGAQLYQLKDATGAIWVLTHRRGVRSGEPIQITGKVRFQSIPVQGKEFGEAYIQEEQVEKVVKNAR
jgi:hypothetical protein